MSTSAVVENTRNVADAGILDRIIAETRLTPDDEAYDLVVGVATGVVEPAEAAAALGRWWG